MKTSLQIRNDIDAYKQKAELILATAEKEDREMTVAEKSEFDKAMAGIEIAKDDLTRRERFEASRQGELAVKMQGLIKDDDPFKPQWVGNAKPTTHAGWTGQDAKTVSNFVKGLLTNDHRLVQNAMSEGSNSAGGFLVPAPLANRIVELRDRRGVARRYCEVVPMTSETLSIPKLTGEVTSHYVAENTTIPESAPTLAQIVLSAKKLACLIPMSNELAEDAILNVAEMLARSIAYEFAGREDDALFNGDATSTYGSIEGLANRLAAGSKVTATSETTFAALTWGSFEKIVGKAQRYTSGEEPRWYFNRAGYYASARRLMNAAGGNDLSTLSMVDAEQSFMGYPVVFSDYIHGGLTTATGEIGCYFGDMRSCVMMGSRKDIRVQADASSGFAKDQVLVRGIERYDINVHDVGTSSVAGGMVALVFG